MNGWLLLNKFIGITSARALNVVKKVVGKGRKVGHCGTLDPAAQGLLLVAIGAATRLVSYLENATKSYEFTIKWGEMRSTEDSEGEVLARDDRRPTLRDIQGVLPRFLGNIKQVPPIYSAINVGGERAYALARKGELVSLSARDCEIFALKILDTENTEAFSDDIADFYRDKQEESRFFLHCSKGTYVRALARDIAAELGVLGYVSRINRVKIADFDLKNAVCLRNLREIPQETLGESIAKNLLPLHAVLPRGVEIFCVNEEKLLFLQNGCAIRVECPEKNWGVGQEIFVFVAVNLVAICRAYPVGDEESNFDYLLKPVKVFRDNLALRND